MRSLFSIPVRESQTCRHSQTSRLSTADTLVEQSWQPVLPDRMSTVSRRKEFAFITLGAVLQRNLRLFVSRGRTGQANPTVQLTATSHTLRHMISDCSITPSLRLRSHPSCRRSAVVSVLHFSPVAVADFFR